MSKKIGWMVLSRMYRVLYMIQKEKFITNNHGLVCYKEGLKKSLYRFLKSTLSYQSGWVTFCYLKPCLTLFW